MDKLEQFPVDKYGWLSQVYPIGFLPFSGNQFTNPNCNSMIAKIGI